METYITFSELNDFIFCPASLYFHQFYKDKEKHTFQSTDQTAGTSAHKAIDVKKYSSGCTPNM